MKTAHISTITPQHKQSPKGTYGATRLDLTAALGVASEMPPERGGHPFAVERTILPPGKQNYPLHSHTALWEFYLVESGNGVLITDSGESELSAGSIVMCEPDEPHALRNTSTDTDFVYLVIANNTLADLIHYPDSGKWMAKPTGQCFNHTLDYYDGEE